MILCGGDVWATSVALRALNLRHAAYRRGAGWALCSSGWIRSCCGEGRPGPCTIAPTTTCLSASTWPASTPRKPATALPASMKSRRPPKPQGGEGPIYQGL